MRRGGLLGAILLLLGVGVAYLTLHLGDAGGRDGPRVAAPVAAEPARSTAPAPSVLAAGEGDRRDTREAPPASQRVPEPAPSEAASGNRALARQQHVSGSVVAATGPLASARVRLDEGKTSLVQTRADDRGQFTLRLARATGPLTLTVTADGYAPLERDLPPVREGEGRLLGNLLLQPATPLRGVVRASGVPIEGAQVELRTRAMGVALNQHVHAARTGTDGSFSFPDAPVGRIELVARAEGHGEAYLDLTHVAERGDVEIELLPERSLVLVLADGSGAPLPELQVSIHAGGRPSAEHFGATDASGRCAFAGLGETMWEARVADDRVRPAARSGLVADGSEYRIEVTPWPCARGRVVTPGGGVPPAGGEVRLVPSSMNGDSIRLAGAEPHPLAPDGSFEICGVRPGQVLARVEVPGFAPTHSSVVRVQLQETLDLGVVVLRRGGALELALQNDEGPVADARVELYISPPQKALIWVADTSTLANLVATGSTDEAGRARFEHLAPGDHWVIVRSARHVPLLDGPFPIPAEGVRDLGILRLDDGAFLEGRVVDEDGRGVLGAFVMLVQDGDDPINVQITTDASGRYASPPLPPGPWLVRARALGGRGTRAPETMQVMLQEGETTRLDVSI